MTFVDFVHLVAKHKRALERKHQADPRLKVLSPSHTALNAMLIPRNGLVKYQ